MICGIFGICGDVSEHWEQSPKLDFAIGISENTGEILGGKKEAQTQGLTLSINEQASGQKTCSFRGSLHKEYKGVNFSRLTFENLQEVIKRMQNTYCIDPKTTALHSLEVEINLYLKHSPKHVIKSAIVHKKKPFAPMNRQAPTLGKVATYSDYEVKLYDKGRQCNLKGENILRFGVKVRKMRFIEQYGIKTLSDLQNPVKVARLSQMLFSTAQNIVFFDYWADTSTLTENQELRYNQYSNPNYWEALDFRKAGKAKEAFTRLSTKINATNFNQQLCNWIGFELLQIFEADNLKKWGCLHHIKPDIKKCEAEKMGMFSHFICMVKNSPENLESDKNAIGVLPPQNDPLKMQNEKRFCVSCGRDISHQKSNSRFCSEKQYGKQAKQCRNKASNQARTQREKIKRLNEWEIMQKVFDLIPKGVKLIVTVSYPKGNKNHRPKLEALTQWEKEKIKNIQSIRFANVGTITRPRAKRFVRMLKNKDYKPLKLISNEQTTSKKPVRK